MTNRTLGFSIGHVLKFFAILKVKTLVSTAGFSVNVDH